MRESRSPQPSIEVTWNVGKATIAGTLVRPMSPSLGSGVVFAAGSGPTDRDWNSPLLPGTNGSGTLLAESLAEVGIASLRYDKSASGPHARENIKALGGITMQHHTDEFAGAARVLADDSSVSADRIFGLGNSEGTLHVLNYQLSDPKVPLAGLVLVAPPGRSVGAVARAQLAAQAAPVPKGEALLALYDEAVTRFVNGEPAAPDPSLPEGVQGLLHSLENPMNHPFARELWLADATSLMIQVNVPMLVVIGKKDVQVSWKDDGELLQRAAEGRDNIAFVFPEDANHVLKHESHPVDDLRPEAVAASYNAPGSQLDESGTTAIIEWLTRHSHPSGA